jgi:hypothetical protein
MERKEEGWFCVLCGAEIPYIPGAEFHKATCPAAKQEALKDG